MSYKKYKMGFWRQEKNAKNGDTQNKKNGDKKNGDSPHFLGLGK